MHSPAVRGGSPAGFEKELPTSLCFVPLAVRFEASYLTSLCLCFAICKMIHNYTITAPTQMTEHWASEVESPFVVLSPVIVSFTRTPDPSNLFIRAGKRSTQTIPVAEGKKEEVRLAQGLCSERMFPFLPCVLLSWSHWTAAQGTWGELAALWACSWSCGTVMGLWWRRLARWWTVQESPGARPGTAASGPESLALLLTEEAKDWVGTPGRGDGQGLLVTLCSRAISERAQDRITEGTFRTLSSSPVRVSNKPRKYTVCARPSANQEQECTLHQVPVGSCQIVHGKP